MRKANTFDAAYIERNTAPIPDTGCLIWLLGVVKGGYGKVSDGGRTSIAHRAIWESQNGPVPKGLVLRHRCDVPACVNVKHLLLGTHADNSADAILRGRMARGERVTISKLTSEQVQEIRRSSATHRELHEQFGVCTATISYIKARKTWRHI